MDNILNIWEVGRGGRDSVFFPLRSVTHTLTGSWEFLFFKEKFVSHSLAKKLVSAKKGKEVRRYSIFPNMAIFILYHWEFTLHSLTHSQRKEIKNWTINTIFINLTRFLLKWSNFSGEIKNMILWLDLKNSRWTSTDY